MSKSEGAKLNYAVRRELRLRRDKTAALLMPYFLGWYADLDDKGRWHAQAASCAVAAADALLAELDATRKDLTPDGF